MYLPSEALATPKYSTHGDAVVTFGVLMLTSDVPGQLGSIVFEHPPNISGHEPTPTSSFIAKFDLRITGACGSHLGYNNSDGDGYHCGGAGLSFNFGVMPSPGPFDDDCRFGEDGVGNGLRVSILTQSNGRRRLVAVYAGATVATAPSTRVFGLTCLSKSRSVTYTTG